jgi:hypothetical protein
MLGQNMKLNRDISVRNCSKSFLPSRKTRLKFSVSGPIEQEQFPYVLILSKSVFHGSKQREHCSQDETS